MKLLGCLLVLVSAACSTPLQKKTAAPEPVELRLSRKSFPIMQGITTSSTTQIVLLLPKHEKFAIELEDGFTGTLQPVISDESVTREFSKVVVRKIRFAGLELKKTYLLKVKTENGIVDFRALQSVDLKSKTVKFAVVSCLDDAFMAEQSAMWKQVIDQKPDYLFMIGDNVYADRKNGVNNSPASPRQLWERYVETRHTLDFFFAKELIPVLAVWDDHDYGMSDGNKTYEYKKESREIFETFFAQDAVLGIWSRGPGVSGWLNAFEQNFVFVDDRSFRTPNEGSGDEEETHWGSEQEKWVLAKLKESTQPSWIIQGDQFFGAYAPFESYERNHPQSFKKIMKQLGEDKEPVVFISGDRHLIEYMKIEKAVLGYPTYELTTSALHAKVHPENWKEKHNPRRMAGSGSHQNFAVIESEAISAKDLRFHLSGFGNGDASLFKYTHQVTR